MFLQFIKFTFFCGYFISVHGMAVDLPTNALQDESHNVLNNIETPEGLQSSVMIFEFNKVNIGNETTRTTAHTNVISAETEGNTMHMFNKTETPKVTTTLSNETVQTDVKIAPSSSLQSIFRNVIVSTLVLTTSILLQDHVLSDVLSRQQQHKILIVAGVVCLFSMVILIPAGLAFGNSSCILFLISFSLLAVHSRSSWKWSWQNRTVLSEFQEFTRTVVYIMVAYLTCEIRDRTDIVLQLKLWIIIYYLAFSINFFYLVDVSASYWEQIFRHLKCEIEDGIELADDSISMKVYRDEEFEKNLALYKLISVLYLSGTALYVALLLIKLPLSEISTPVMFYDIFVELVLLSPFWFMRKELFEFLERFNKTHKTCCIGHPTEGIMNFFMFVLDCLPSALGFKYIQHYQCRANTALADNNHKYKKNKSPELYQRFQGTMCVLYQNESYLYVIHIVMAIALLPYSSEHFI